jgi:flagellar basal body-associated protein FliL
VSEMNEAPPKKKKLTWLWILLGVFAFFVITGIGMVVFTAYWVGSHVEIVETPPADAVKTFEDAWAKFPGQRPLLEIVDGKPQELTAAATNSSTRLTTLHIIAFDDNENQMVRVDVPFWLLRLKSGPISFNSYASGFDDRKVKLSVEDIEKHGPGIVVDYSERNEGRVLIWAE